MTLLVVRLFIKQPSYLDPSIREKVTGWWN